MSSFVIGITRFIIVFRARKQKLIIQKAIKLRAKESKAAAGIEKQQQIREASLAKYRFVMLRVLCLV